MLKKLSKDILSKYIKELQEMQLQALVLERPIIFEVRVRKYEDGGCSILIGMNENIFADDNDACSYRMLVDIHDEKYFKDTIEIVRNYIYG